MSLGKFLIMKMTTFQFTKQKNSPCFTEPVVFLYGCVCPVLCQLCFSPSSKWRTFLRVPRCYYCCLIFHSITYAHPVVFLASLVAQLVKSSPAVLETRVQSLGREDRREKGMHPSPVFLPGESHGQRSLSGYSPWDHKRVRHDWAANTFTYTESSPLILEVRRVDITETAVGAGRTWKQTRGISVELVMLFLDVQMGTWMFQFGKMPSS